MKTTLIGLTQLTARSMQAAEQQPHRSPEESFGETTRQLGLIKNTEKAFPGYTFFVPKHFTKTYLMDNNGMIVNEWESQYEPGQF